MRRIWVGPNLVYDAGSSDADTIVASNDAAVGFKIYTGTDTQSADPRIQADKGAANTPPGAAWPISSSTICNWPSTKIHCSGAGQSRGTCLGHLGRCCQRRHHALIDRMGKYGILAHCGRRGGGWIGNQHELRPVVGWWIDVVVALRDQLGPIRHRLWGGKFVAIRSYFNSLISSDDGLSFSVIASMPFNGSSWLSICFGNGVLRPAFGRNGMLHIPGRHDVDCRYCSQPVMGGCTVGGTVFCAIAKNTNISATSSDGRTWTEHSTMPSTTAWEDLAWNGSVFVAVGAAGVGATSPDGVTWTAITLPGGLGYFEVEALGAFLCCHGLVLYAGGVFQRQRCHMDAIFHAVVAGLEGVDCVERVFVAAGRASTAGAKITLGMLGAGQLLSTIVSAECLQSGLLAAGDIDVTGLTQSVRGYRIGNVGTIRSALEPLQSSWPFDVVQRGYKIWFLVRGGSAVATIAAADLDARQAGASPGVQITTSREIDSQMPRRVLVKHLDYDREYDTGAQYDERLNTIAIHEVVLDLPIVLTSGEAAARRRCCFIWPGWSAPTCHSACPAPMAPSRPPTWSIW